MYKLVAGESGGDVQPSMKLLTGKVTYPGAKSVRRFTHQDGYHRDVLARMDEDIGGEELLVDVVRDGELVSEFPELGSVRESTLDTLEKLPAGVRALEDTAEYTVDISDGLAATTKRVRAEITREMGL